MMRGERGANVNLRENVIDVSEMSDQPGTETISTLTVTRKGRDSEGRWHDTELIFCNGYEPTAYIDNMRAQVSDINALEFPGEVSL